MKLGTPWTAAIWSRFLQQLGPRGAAWSDTASRLAALWDGLGPEFARIHALLPTLLVEVDPTKMVDCLPGLEVALDLPEDFMPPVSSLADRRAAVCSRLAVTAWSQTPAAFVALAEGWGVTVEIRRLAPHWFGVFSESGDWTFARFGADDFGVSFGTLTYTEGANVLQLFTQRKRAHARFALEDYLPEA